MNPFAAALVLVLPVLGPASGPEPAAPPKARIVLVYTTLDHPWASHMYEHECRLLAACLNQTPGVDAVVSPDAEWPKDPAIFKDVKSIVYYSKSAGDIVLSPSHREEFRKMMGAGVGYCAIHWATKAEEPEFLAEYLLVLGGAFHSKTNPTWDLDISTQPLVQIEPEHPVCRGWKSFDLHDEWYLGMLIESRARPVIKVHAKGRDETVAWVLERPGNGRSFGTTLGHFHENFTLEPFRKALVNGILWSAHIEVPTAGAPVEIGKDLADIGPEPAKK
jgi:type 1 glutamine amidotransferase